MKIRTEIEIKNIRNEWVRGKIVSIDRAKVAGKTKTLLEVQTASGALRYAYSDQCRIAR